MDGEVALHDVGDMRRPFGEREQQQPLLAIVGR